MTTEYSHKRCNQLPQPTLHVYVCSQQVTHNSPKSWSAIGNPVWKLLAMPLLPIIIDKVTLIIQCLNVFVKLYMSSL